MALSDPISITVNGGAHNFARIDSGNRSGKYFYDTGDNATGKYYFTVSHTEGKRRRSVARIDHSQISEDVFGGDIGSLVSGSLYLVVDQPIFGFASTEYSDLYTGLTGALEASSSALLTKFLNGES